ncbi:GNAT family N-acetyltransferase [Timonella sp. A28]|uniref:GNAT family N-acetyltransferase n=1 Tax=Timonella sp. A28 TaxID=3442640 RepID=UPI003EB9B02A
MTHLDIRELVEPLNPTHKDSALVNDMRDLYLHCALHDFGHTDFVPALAGFQESLMSTQYNVIRSFVVHENDIIVGALKLVLPQKDNTHLITIEFVARDNARHVLDLLHTTADSIANDTGRTTFMAWEDHTSEPSADHPNALEAPTGVGRVDASDPLIRAHLDHGFTLEQTQRYSVLALPADPALLHQFESQAAAKAGPEYELVSWQDTTPEEFLDGHATLQHAMSTDVPLGDLDITETHYDADRIKQLDANVARAGNGYLFVAARHIPSGELAGFTRVEYEKDRPEGVFQQETLVRTGYRGRSLGMWVKAAMLTQLMTVRPGARRLHTWNAGENSYMLDINVALGFEQHGTSSAWQKLLQQPETV